MGVCVFVSMHVGFGPYAHARVKVFPLIVHAAIIDNVDYIFYAAILFTRRIETRPVQHHGSLKQGGGKGLEENSVDTVEVNSEYLLCDGVAVRILLSSMKLSRETAAGDDSVRKCRKYTDQKVEKQQAIFHKGVCKQWLHHYYRQEFYIAAMFKYLPFQSSSCSQLSLK